MKKTAFILLGILITAQLLIPISMILNHERILRTGTLCRFKTRPVDPADPFQGRYVQLNFESDYIPGTNETASIPEYRERVFVTLSTNADGFCELKSWSRTKPETGTFLKLTCTGPHHTWDSQERTNHFKGIRFDLPFDRFYMDENKAPRAEQLARRRNVGLRAAGNTNGFTNCWATVRVLNGAARIDDILIDGTSIRELSAQSTQ